MKALAIDSAITRLTISAKNEDKFFTAIYDIGMKQSETIVPAIEEVLQKVSLEVKDLDYIVSTSGPGSFTGLRLAFSCIKALELAYNIPVYAIPTLQAYCEPFKSLKQTTICAIDANKDRFYCRIFDENNEILPDGDYTIEQIIANCNDFSKLLICGPDSKKLQNILEENLPACKTILLNNEPAPTLSLFKLAEEQISNKKDPLKDFEGPVYMRASEAEIVLQNKQ